MGSIHQPFCGHTGQHPGQFHDFRYIRLAVKNRIGGVQTQRQPGCGDFKTGLPDPFRLLAFNQGMIIGQKIEWTDIGVLAGENSRPDGADIVA